MATGTPQMTVANRRPRKDGSLLASRYFNPAARGMWRKYLGTKRPGYIGLSYGKPNYNSKTKTWTQPV